MSIKVKKVVKVETPSRIQIEDFLISHGWDLSERESTHTEKKDCNVFRLPYYEPFSFRVIYRVGNICIYYRGYDYYKSWDDHVQKLLKEIADWSAMSSYEVWQEMMAGISNELRDYRHARYTAVLPVGSRKLLRQLSLERVPQEDRDELIAYRDRAIKMRKRWIDSL